MTAKKEQIEISLSRDNLLNPSKQATSYAKAAAMEKQNNNITKSPMTMVPRLVVQASKIPKNESSQDRTGDLLRVKET